jgi:tetratricopeptide (TPR) repeat protein
MVADVNGMMWKEAKTMAINTEAKRVCAQIRIASLVRKLQQSSRYRVAKVAVLIIETRVRQFLSRILVASLLRARNDDDIYKFHTRCSLLIQKSWRRYFWRNRFVQHQEQRVADQRQKIASIRAKLREQRKRDAESIVYRDVIRVDSTIAAVTIFFQDDSAFQENVVMLMKVYVPTTHETFTFRLEEKTVRDCLENSLSSPGKLSWNEMLNADALKELPKRLILRVVRGRPIFLFSRRNIVEKGTLLKKVAVLAADDVFILSLFRSPYEFAFVTYQPSTCDQMRTKLPNAKLSEWLRGSSPPPCYQLQQSEDCRDKSEGMLDLLKPERQKELLDWIVQRVLIRKHPDDPSAMQLLLQFEAEEERVVKLVTKVQSQWRRFRSLRQAKTQTFVQYEKIYNREYKMYAYRNVVTDERQWVKPKLLGDADLSSPVDEWRQVQAEDGSKYYVNYGTGQTSWLSEEDAARLVQRRYRSKHEADLLGDKMQFSDIVKAMHFIYGARTKYEEEPNKLSNMVNFAMVRHCLDLDFVGAKPVYEKAIKLSPNHPLISRAYGIFLLASRQPTELLSFQTATRLFAEADVSDPSQAQIRSAAQIYFRWAVMGNAKNPLALLNYALLHQCIYKEYDHAEKIYRAALAIDPTNTNVVENFSLFLRERYPGGAYASNGPPFSVVRRSVILEERPEWAEWQKLIDNMCPRKGFEVFYYNRFTKATQFDEPDWDEVYETRVKRSSVVSGKMTNWVEYWDPRLEESFFKNHATKKFTCAPYKQS